jgi:hypothetical protein
LSSLRNDIIATLTECDFGDCVTCTTEDTCRDLLGALEESCHPESQDLLTWFSTFRGKREDVPEYMLEKLVRLLQDPMVTLIEEVEELERE